MSERNRSYRETNRDRIAAKNREWSERNAERRKAYAAEYRVTHAAERAALYKTWSADNADHLRAYHADYYAANRERKRLASRQSRLARIDECRARDRLYGQRPDIKARKRAHSRQRKALLKTRPPGYDHEAVMAIYALAYRMETITGESYHVDHVHPLSKGGLHHQDNLVVMRGDWNLRKSASVWPWVEWFNRP